MKSIAEELQEGCDFLAKTMGTDLLPSHVIVPTSMLGMLSRQSLAAFSGAEREVWMVQLSDLLKTVIEASVVKEE